MQINKLLFVSICKVQYLFCLFSDLRVLKLFSHRPWQRELVNWYPANHSTLLLRLGSLGLYHDEHTAFTVQMANQRKDRGKGPPEKGKDFKL